MNRRATRLSGMGVMKRVVESSAMVEENGVWVAATAAHPLKIRTQWTCKLECGHTVVRVWNKNQQPWTAPATCKCQECKGR